MLAQTWTSAFPATMPGAEHRPPCGHRLVLSLCLCLLRHSSAISHHHHMWGAGAAPLHLRLQQSPQRDPCDTASLKNASRVSERSVSSYLQGSLGLLCPAQACSCPEQAAHPRGGAESMAATPSTAAGPAMPTRHSEGCSPVFPRIPPAKCPPNPSFGDAHQYTARPAWSAAIA